MKAEVQTVPVRIYDREKHIVLAAPLPGLEAENISITVGGNRIVISGEERGPRQHGPDVVLAEWSIGPYYREISLHQAVKGPLTNATYGNGVLVPSMPKGEKNEAEPEVNFKLHTIAATRGEWVGHIGSEIHSSSSGCNRGEYRGNGMILTRR
jgi:HSP20 family molecular chaperone IbpA